MTLPVGAIVQFAAFFPPAGFLECNGQLVAIASYPALYAVLGTTWGGDGITTFAVPEARGRSCLHQGIVAGGVTNKVVGNLYGADTNALDATTNIAHSHAMYGSSLDGFYSTATGNVPGTMDGENAYHSAHSGAKLAAASMTTGGGSGAPYSLMMPYVAVKFCIKY